MHAHSHALLVGPLLVASLAAPAGAQTILVLSPAGASSVEAPLAAAGYTVVAGTLDPGQISANLALHPETEQVWIWNDGYGKAGMPADPAREFDAQDLADLDAFVAGHPNWIMDGRAWRWHVNSDEVNLSKNEAVLLSAHGGGVVLGTDDASGDAIVQHVNQVSAYFGFDLWHGVYDPLYPHVFGPIFQTPIPVDPAGLTYNLSYCDVPNGLQPNGVVLSTVFMAEQSVETPGYPSPALQHVGIEGALYFDVVHMITTSIPGAGPDEVRAFCVPAVEGVTSCPCGNPPGNFGAGCDNSDATGGGVLTLTGSFRVSADGAVLESSGEKPNATSIFLQGSSEIVGGTVFGQGIRCTGGNLKRLYVKTASAGTALAPEPGDDAISARSAALGDPLGAGETRYYQTYYRDPAVLGGCPSVSTFNVTQGLAITWLP